MLFTASGRGGPHHAGRSTCGPSTSRFASSPTVSTDDVGSSDRTGVRPKDTLSPLRDLAESWREDAARFRQYDAEKLAAACDLHADALEDRLRSWWSERLTVAEAAVWSGYSEDRLRTLAREDRLSAFRENGRIWIPRCALPRKPGLEAPASGLGEEESGPISSREQMARTVVKSE